MIEKVLKDGWKPEAYERLRVAFSKEGKWTQYFNNLLDNCDRAYLKGLMMAFGYEGGFRGFRETQKNAKKLGVKHIPWIILLIRPVPAICDALAVGRQNIKIHSICLTMIWIVLLHREKNLEFMNMS